MLRKKGSSWEVLAKSTGKVLGKHPSKAQAVKQLQAIEISKAKKKSSWLS